MSEAVRARNSEYCYPVIVMMKGDDKEDDTLRPFVLLDPNEASRPVRSRYSENGYFELTTLNLVTYAHRFANPTDVINTLRQEPGDDADILKALLQAKTHNLL